MLFELYEIARVGLEPLPISLILFFFASLSFLIKCL